MITISSSKQDTCQSGQMKYLKDDIDQINQQFNALGMKMLDKFDMYETENETSVESPMAKVFERSPDTFGAASDYKDDPLGEYFSIPEFNRNEKNLFENSMIKTEDHPNIFEHSQEQKQEIEKPKIELKKI